MCGSQRVAIRWLTSVALKVTEYEATPLNAQTNILVLIDSALSHLDKTNMLCSLMVQLLLRDAIELLAHRVEGKLFDLCLFHVLKVVHVGACIRWNKLCCLRKDCTPAWK